MRWFQCTSDTVTRSDSEARLSPVPRHGGLARDVRRPQAE
jgi:hypothetical protein